MQILKTDNSTQVNGSEVAPISASKTEANTGLFSRYSFKKAVATPMIIGSIAIFLGDISTRGRLLSIALIITSLAILIIQKYAQGLITDKPTEPPSNELPPYESTPAELPKITLQNFFPLLVEEEENKPYLPEVDCVHTLLYLSKHQDKLIAEAKRENRCVRVKAHDHPDLPRTIVVTPEGKIFIVLNKTSKGDKIVGTGTFKVVKRCFELTEQKMCTHATFKNPKDPEKIEIFLKRWKKEIFCLNCFRGEPYLLGSLATSAYISKQGIPKCSIITTYYTRGNLNTLLETTEFSVHEKKAFCCNTALAIQRMHSLGHAHCDIKPENILVDEIGNPVLIDFEGSLEINEENKKKIAGTILHLHPIVIAYRKARKEEDVEAKLKLEKCLPSLTSRDIWALGVLFLKMAKPKERLPWDSGLATDIPNRVQTAQEKLINLLKDPRKPVFQEPTDTTSLEYLAWNMLQVDEKMQWTLEQVISFLQKNPT